jgi:hypothetical protein
MIQQQAALMDIVKGLTRQLPVTAATADELEAQLNAVVPINLSMKPPGPTMDPAGFDS